MLEVGVDVVKGVMFVNLEGELTKDTVDDFEKELNYLLYKQGMHFFVINFRDLISIEYGILNWLQNKLVEIFLSCGNVVMCGLNDLWKKKLGVQEKLFYANDEVDALKILTI